MRSQYSDICVSIRSPHRSKGRRPSGPTGGCRLMSFNPLPSPKQGETSVGQRTGNGCTRFNPLPSPKQGETRHEEFLRDMSAVSIRSPHRSKGRQAPSAGALDEGKFQSAPLTEARGDGRPGWWSPRLWRFNPLPSPKQGETSRHWPTRHCIRCFNPLPSPKQGETQTTSIQKAAASGFNPLPSPKQGETLDTEAN